MYYQHKFKCQNCGLHFIVCSWIEGWPEPRGQKTRAKAVTCPECGNKDEMLHAVEQVDGEIYMAVPGNAPWMQPIGGKYRGES
uniref:Uncharacterized protein n=1 Tax=viral metagenome TaxID=1070528 RepID=A0A6H1ZH30_9ZZZZ